MYTMSNLHMAIKHHIITHESIGNRLYSVIIRIYMWLIYNNIII